ncbi:LysR substrate-binding domain-containing protein [Lichenifustis flavocetrariae]|uniref:LysR substrate-binding domain-containing protein n=1 Tax=Lichenifustis flavocetrariae TaxID=2949735 RepID=A0AA41Z4Q9_9HYPH|nr:LysR substrate-binding domain-containing protein [Lichenifustis flavocetrariae]MCW6510270.1 LysR substrate-binding domain-containing protein [Lichenifustis flavocetrariae]
MRLPSTQALRALEAFARHGSVWRAAEELNLTRSAVSHQLRLLEQDLGFDVLKRAGKGATLTPQGRRYAVDVRKALTLLGDAAVQYGEKGIRGALTLSCTPGFASFWLCTHVAEFKQLYPDVALRIVTPARLDDVNAPEVDAFIAYGDGNWPRCSVELLSAVEFTPLCSPVLLNQIGGLAEPRDVFRALLLHLNDHDDWVRWFAAAGLAPGNLEQGVVFSDMNLVLAAASAAQGIAMGDELTCRQALDTGRLVRPFDLAIRSNRAYYFVAEDRRSANPAIHALSDWLKSRLAQTAPVLRPA